MGERIDALRHREHAGPVLYVLAVAVAASGGPGPALVRRLGPAARPALRALTSSPTTKVAGAAKSLVAELPTAPRQVLQLRTLGPLTLVRDGEVVGREPLDTARARHHAARAELPHAAQQMSRGEPVIPTLHV